MELVNGVGSLFDNCVGGIERGEGFMLEDDVGRCLGLEK